MLLFILLFSGCQHLPDQLPDFTASKIATLQPAGPTETAITTAQSALLGQHPYSLEVNVSAGQITQPERVDYLLYLPAAYGEDPAYRWPLILYLHGSGECGTDLSLLLKQPLPENLALQTDFPFIVVSPQAQCSYDTQYSYTNPNQLAWTWSNRWQALRALLDDLQAMYVVDPRRIYLTGISLGGFGTWQIALGCPDCFAAIVPMAGGYVYGSDQVPENICELKNLPIWAFHGEQDTNVSYKQSQVLVDALLGCGGDVRFTLYPDLGHNVWGRAYADPVLIQWLLEQHKP